MPVARKKTAPDVAYPQAVPGLHGSGFAEGAVTVDQDKLASDYGLSQRDLLETAGIAASAAYRKSRLASNASLTRIREMAEILHRVSHWAGGNRQALAWYRAEPIPAFGGQTAEGIVKSGRASALRDYLDHIALGGFA